MVANATLVPRDNFIPSQADTDNTSYIGWMWLSRVQYTQYTYDGTIPGYKDMRSDTVHKHYRAHNAPDSCINLHIHTHWNSQSSDIYNSTPPTFLLAWKTTMPQILGNCGTMGRTFSSIYYTRTC
eukprot:6491675-Amphidinium_carterae.4